MEKLRAEYGTNSSPDDVRFKPIAEEFRLAFKAHDPKRVPDEEEGDIIEGPFDEKVPIEDREYSAPRAAPSLTIDDSLKFGGSAPKFQ
mmetsp:Transcript_9275/g.11315  ORF Transcript_9275/g.11315 Transcript_9275/m.11315 type:complete len:88 (+) Transcript_9275:291-554(+)